MDYPVCTIADFQNMLQWGSQLLWSDACSSSELKASHSDCNLKVYFCYGVVNRGESKLRSFYVFQGQKSWIFAVCNWPCNFQTALKFCNLTGMVTSSTTSFYLFVYMFFLYFYFKKIIYEMRTHGTDVDSNQLFSRILIPFVIFTVNYFPLLSV